MKKLSLLCVPIALLTLIASPIFAQEKKDDAKKEDAKQVAEKKDAEAKPDKKSDEGESKLDEPKQKGDAEEGESKLGEPKQKGDADEGDVRSPQEEYELKLKKLESGLAALVEKHGKDSKEVKRAKRNIATLKNFLSPDKGDEDKVVSPQDEYAAKLAKLEKGLPALVEKHGADSKQVKRAKSRIATLKDFLSVGKDEPTEVASPQDEYQQKLKKLQASLEGLIKKHGKDSKQVKDAKEEIATLKDFLKADGDDAGESSAPDSVAGDSDPAGAAESGDAPEPPEPKESASDSEADEVKPAKDEPKKESKEEAKKE